jgi:hypothetical protein
MRCKCSGGMGSSVSLITQKITEDDMERSARDASAHVDTEPTRNSIHDTVRLPYDRSPTMQKGPAAPCHPHTKCLLSDPVACVDAVRALS